MSRRLNFGLSRKISNFNWHDLIHDLIHDPIRDPIRDPVRSGPIQSDLEFVHARWL